MTMITMGILVILVLFLFWIYTLCSKEGRIKRVQKKTIDWQKGDSIKVTYSAYRSSDDTWFTYEFVGSLIAWHYKYVVVEYSGSMKKYKWSHIKNLSAKQRKEHAEMKQIIS